MHTRFILPLFQVALSRSDIKERQIIYVEIIYVKKYLKIHLTGVKVPTQNTSPRVIIKL